MQWIRTIRETRIEQSVEKRGRQADAIGCGPVAAATGHDEAGVSAVVPVASRQANEAPVLHARKSKWICIHGRPPGLSREASDAGEPRTGSGTTNAALRPKGRFRFQGLTGCNRRFKSYDNWQHMQPV